MLYKRLATHWLQWVYRLRGPVVRKVDRTFLTICRDGDRLEVGLVTHWASLLRSFLRPSLSRDSLGRRSGSSISYPAIVDSTLWGVGGSAFGPRVDRFRFSVRLESRVRLDLIGGRQAKPSKTGYSRPVSDMRLSSYSLDTVCFVVLGGVACSMEGAGTWVTWAGVVFE